MLRKNKEEPAKKIRKPRKPKISLRKKKKPENVIDIEEVYKMINSVQSPKIEANFHVKFNVLKEDFPIVINLLKDTKVSFNYKEFKEYFSFNISPGEPIGESDEDVLAKLEALEDEIPE